MKKITIAIDGFSSCGKSTMAKDLAREVGYIYIDSGAMYRAVTLYSIENGIARLSRPYGLLQALRTRQSTPERVLLRR